MAVVLSEQVEAKELVGRSWFRRERRRQVEIVSSVGRGFGRNGGDWGRRFGRSVWPLEGQGW